MCVCLLASAAVAWLVVHGGVNWLSFCLLFSLFVGYALQAWLNLTENCFGGFGWYASCRVGPVAFLVFVPAAAFSKD